MISRSVPVLKGYWALRAALWTKLGLEQPRAGCQCLPYQHTLGSAYFRELGLGLRV